jgi:hypothetical protein
MQKPFFRRLFSAASFFVLTSTALHAADSLPCWNDTTAKKAIVAFVQKATAVGSTGFVSPEQRIATYGSNGVRGAAQPMCF